MSVTVASVRRLHPEFSSAHAGTDLTDANITEFIAEAETECQQIANLGQHDYDTAVDRLTCHKIALSPYAAPLRLVAENDVTIYWKQYQDIRRRAGACNRVLP